MQFTGEDDGGVTGTLTRTGTASSDGTSLTVTVPALAKSGPVRLAGSGARRPASRADLALLGRVVAAGSHWCGGVGAEGPPGGDDRRLAAAVTSLVTGYDGGTPQQV